MEDFRSGVEHLEHFDGDQDNEDKNDADGDESKIAMNEFFEFQAFGEEM